MPRHPRLSEFDRRDAIANAARCRGSRAHRMDPIPTPPGSPRPLMGSLIVYRCDLCGTLRYDSVSRLTGQLFSRAYDHPDWYQEALAEGQEPAWWRATYWSGLGDEFFLEAEEIVVPMKRKRA